MSLIPKNIDDKLKSKNVDTEKFKNLAAGVKPSDLEDEKKVRQLIRQLASIANTEIDAAKEEQILAYI
ncbi:stage VI sporulation protein F, partial [Acinetobacter baumannii]|uniref:stage VI sporulation protein F n=1 Tax=Acinetobacter baumannii TaxID=470 RepID=UPI00070A527F